MVAPLPARTLVSSTVLLVLVLGCHCSCPEVNVTGGAIVGSEQTSAGGRPYYAYMAVPFAGFVEGQHRFELPRPVTPWRGVLSCEEQGPMCAQSGYSTITGEEDCLHLSVYTPKMPTGGDSSLLPVLVWLPGGAFIVSGAADYDPSLLMDKDMVVVVPQYRLGLLGFMYAFSEGPGNYGMFDQLAALQWVQANIAQFGGDPTRVTLGGDCAGGASALYHMIAPKSIGLFHQVLSLSGSPLSPWAQHPQNRRAMLVLAGYLKCPKADMKDMMHCYRSIPKDDLLEAQMYLLESRDMYVGNGNLAPVVQKHASKTEENQFLEEEPVLSFMDGHFAEVPVLLMASKDVGNYMVDMSLYDWMLTKQKEDGDKFNNEKLMSILIKEMGVEPDSEYQEKILAEYLPGLKDASYEDMLPRIGRMLGDAMYNAGLVHTARYLNDKVPTWVLRFDFEAGPHLFNERHPDPALAPPIPPGAGHGDELHYFFPKKYQPFETEEQKRASALMLEMIDNFVNGLPPAQDWPAPSDQRVECGVVTAKGTLSRDQFLPPRRLAASEIMFKQQHKVALRRREEEIERQQQRDEL